MTLTETKNILLNVGYCHIFTHINHDLSLFLENFDVIMNVYDTHILQVELSLQNIEILTCTTCECDLSWQ